MAGFMDSSDWCGSLLSEASHGGCTTMESLPDWLPAFLGLHRVRLNRNHMRRFLGSLICLWSAGALCAQAPPNAPLGAPLSVDLHDALTRARAYNPQFLA